MTALPYRCQFCGAPSWIDPSDQELPPDYCHESEHGWGTESEARAVILLHPAQAADPTLLAMLPEGPEYRVMPRVGGPSYPLREWLNSRGNDSVPNVLRVTEARRNT